VLEHILSHEQCDVDPINRLEGATPLHLAVKIPQVDLRRYIVESLLDAGANTALKNKHGETVLDALRLYPDDGKQLESLIRRAQALSRLSKNDLANDSDDDEPGSDSDED